MKTIGMHVHDLTCAACDAAVRKALAQVAGVESVQIDLPHKRVTVTYDEAAASVETLRAAVEGAGFEVG